jgi:hypothetical protein
MVMEGMADLVAMTGEFVAAVWGQGHAGCAACDGSNGARDDCAGAGADRTACDWTRDRHGASQEGCDTDRNGCNFHRVLQPP